MSSMGRHAPKDASKGAPGMTPRHGAILPLPDEVVAQIKSSTAITSLTGVVLELLKNALDARAPKVEATVDFARGGCSVEDSGLGIAPSDFREEGGLGKLYRTSKYHSEDEYLGRHGTFLASLGALSLLTITSRHHEFRSHNTLTLHHSKVIDRQLPASPQHEIQGKHGTRVAVRNLFGNLPVRVKQRGIAAEQRSEHDRLWELLKREVTNLVLSWREPVSLRIRDVDGKMCLSLSTAGHHEDSTRRRPSRLYAPLNVLTQAGFTLHEEWPSWVPVSASTPTVCIKGAISLDPAPSKRVQFMSLGATPLNADIGHNELYDEVNRLFALSSFGTVEHDANIDEDEQLRRQNDHRFRSDAYTSRQLKTRKKADRYPMFHLRLSLKQDDKLKRAETLFKEDHANFSTVADVLKAMITEWLTVHHFRPRKSLREHVYRPASAASSLNTASDDTASPDHQLRQPAMSNHRMRKRSQGPLSRKDMDRNHHLAFSEWSRIKSGSATFLDTLGTKRDVRPSDHSASIVQNSTAPYFADFGVEPVLAGSLDGGTGSDRPVTEPCCVDEGRYDKSIPWTDLITKKTYLLNARTGCVLPNLPARPQTDPLPNDRSSTLSDFNKSLRLRPDSARPNSQSRTWLTSVLRTWENPVFKPAETRIQQVPPREEHRDPSCTHSGYFNSRRGHRIENMDAMSTTVASKLSRAGLENAEVMAQVDRKFILAKMKSSKDDAKGLGSDGVILVLIDQHAADERVRVEALLAQLCAPLPKGTRSYRTQLGHESQVIVSILDKPIQFTLSSQEQGHFKTHAVRFAAWGILFDIVDSTTSSTRLQSVLSVTALPPVISERCKADPQILIAFLRTAVWKYADAIHHPPPPDGWKEQNESSHVPGRWVRRISSCPEGLIDLVNSRACRSAIMFNDELSLEQCRELVRKLCRCVFPFMCAHGRPSMVPLVDISPALGLDTPDQKADGDFVTAWKRWRTQ